MTHENRKIGGGVSHAHSEEQKISEMLCSLNRVEAPKDFDFHLKARIANARPADYRQTGLVPVLKYAMPLALFLVIGAGALVYNSYNTTLDVNMVAGPKEPADTSSALPPETPAAVPELSPENLIVASPGSEARGRTTGAEGPRAASRPEKPGGGSHDFTPSPEVVPPGNSKLMTVRGAPTPHTPRGISLNSIGVSEALEQINAEASFENGVWVVRSIKANGIADQIGLRAGDKLKTIDGKPVDEKTQFERGFRARSIQVQRGDATVELGRKPE